MNQSPTTETAQREYQAFLKRIRQCPILGSLRSVNESLIDLTRDSNCHAVQIAEVIRRDPSLTTRILRLVNSVFAGLRSPVTDLESAVFYLGLSAMRQLAISSRFIEELGQLTDEGESDNWVRLWRHSIATAHFTREILSIYGTSSTDDLDYLVGLLHNVGKIVMAYAFRAEFQRTLKWNAPTPEAFALLERTTFGWDHAEIGAEYLRMHRLNDAVVAAVRWHNDPAMAGNYASYASAVQVAESLARFAGAHPGVEELDPVEEGHWLNLAGWAILFPDDSPKSRLAQAALCSSLRRMPDIFQALF